MQISVRPTLDNMHELVIKENKNTRIFRFDINDKTASLLIIELSRLPEYTELSRFDSILCINEVMMYLKGLV